MDRRSLETQQERNGMPKLVVRIFDYYQTQTPIRTRRREFVVNKPHKDVSWLNSLIWLDDVLAKKQPSDKELSVEHSN